MNLAKLENFMYSGSAVLGFIDYSALPGTVDIPVKERLSTAINQSKVDYHDIWNNNQLSLQEKLVKATEVNFSIICLELEFQQDEVYHRSCLNFE